jgi:L-methionine (R)-S-oxide reductase
MVFFVCSIFKKAVFQNEVACKRLQFQKKDNHPDSYLCITMAEDLSIITGTKEEQYQQLIPFIKGVLEGETDLIANLGNVSAVLKEQFKWWWIGFYLVKDGELVLGPFQGPLACTSSSWEKATTLIVPDVDKFPGHIACSSLSKSEIVIPVIRNSEVVAVLDADSEFYNHYDETDKQYLELIVEMIPYSFNNNVTVSSNSFLNSSK